MRESRHERYLYAVSGARLVVLPVHTRASAPCFRGSDTSQRRLGVYIASWCEGIQPRECGDLLRVGKRLVVIDVDSAAGLEALAKFGRLPETPCVKTGHGWHYYFKHPGFKQGNKAGMIEGVDVRGDGGYVIAPPSVHETGVVYEWAVTPDAAPLADLPEWLIRLMRPPVAPPPGSAAATRSAGERE